jgi:hypothetical protein
LIDATGDAQSVHGAVLRAIAERLGVTFGA